MSSRFLRSCVAQLCEAWQQDSTISVKKENLEAGGKRFYMILISDVAHLSGQFQDCHINEESLELEGSSKNDRSLKIRRVVGMSAKF